MVVIIDRNIIFFRESSRRYTDYFFAFDNLYDKLFFSTFLSFYIIFLRDEKLFTRNNCIHEKV